MVEYYPISAKDQSRIHQFGKKVLPGLFLGYALYAGGIWFSDVLVADLEGVGNDGRIRNLLEQTQCKGRNISQTKWKNYFSSRRWTNQSFWKRSGTENIHFDTGSPNSRRKSQRFSWKIRRSLSLPQDSLPDAGEAINDFRSFQETSYTAITLNPESNFTLREKNHFLFH